MFPLFQQIWDVIRFPGEDRAVTFEKSHTTGGLLITDFAIVCLNNEEPGH